MEGTCFFREGQPWLALPSDWSAVLSLCLPGSYVYRDRLVVVPDSAATRDALDDLGIQPALQPDLPDYSWPGDLPPMRHQRMTAAFLVTHQRAAVLNEIGTGKTLSALWAWHYLYERKRCGKLLVLTTKSTLHSAWGDTIFRHLSRADVRGQVLYASSMDRRRKLMREGADVEVTNYHGFMKLGNDMHGRYGCIVIDEATAYKNAFADRYVHLSHWLRRETDLRLWLMTGTPAPNSPVDAWALARLVGGRNVPPSRQAAQTLLEKQLNKFRWIPRPEAPEAVVKMLQPCIRFRRDECMDLPETTWQTRRVDMTPAQTKVYKQMEVQGIAELEQGGQVTAVNEGVVRQRLLQISAGAGYAGGDTGVVELHAKPRIAAVEEAIGESEGKVLVFVPWVGVLHLLASHIETGGDVHGRQGVGRGERDEAPADIPRLPGGGRPARAARAAGDDGPRPHPDARDDHRVVLAALQRGDLHPGQRAHRAHGQERPQHRRPRRGHPAGARRLQAPPAPGQAPGPHPRPGAHAHEAALDTGGVIGVNWE